MRIVLLSKEFGIHFSLLERLDFEGEVFSSAFLRCQASQRLYRERREAFCESHLYLHGTTSYDAKDFASVRTR